MSVLAGSADYGADQDMHPDQGISSIPSCPAPLITDGFAAFLSTLQLGPKTSIKPGSLWMNGHASGFPAPAGWEYDQSTSKASSCGTWCNFLPANNSMVLPSIAGPGMRFKKPRERGVGEMDGQVFTTDDSLHN